MAKEDKKKVRNHFRSECLERDKFTCRGCGYKSTANGQDLDCHHIQNREEMPNGGYVKENGISLCDTCHEKAEEFHSTGTAHPGFALGDLYNIIDSSYDAALVASKKLK